MLKDTIGYQTSNCVTQFTEITSTDGELKGSGIYKCQRSKEPETYFN